MLARTAVQPRVLVALIQCATLATEVVEIATESEEGVVINCVAIFYEEGKGGKNFRKKITSFVVIVGLQVRAVSVFGKKSDAVCGFLAYFCAVLRFSDPPYAPLNKNTVTDLIFSHHPEQSRHISVKTVEYRSRKFIF